MSYRMLTGVPARKVNAAAIAAAAVQVLVWLLGLLFGVLVPSGVEVALVTLAVYAAGYLTPPAARDGVISSEAHALSA